MAERLGKQATLSIVRQTLLQRCPTRGRKLWRGRAPRAQPVYHFVTFWDRRAEVPGTFELNGFDAGQNELSLTVTPCGYLELYQSLGAPLELAVAFSCASSDHGLVVG